jgi:hypothetical protein
MGLAFCVHELCHRRSASRRRGCCCGSHVPATGAFCGQAHIVWPQENPQENPQDKNQSRRSEVIRAVSALDAANSFFPAARNRSHVTNRIMGLLRVCPESRLIVGLAADSSAAGIYDGMKPEFGDKPSSKSF